MSHRCLGQMSGSGRYYYACDLPTIKNSSFPLLFTRIIPFFLQYFFFAEMERYMLMSWFVTFLTTNLNQPSYEGLRKRPNTRRTYYPAPAIPFLSPRNQKQFRKPRLFKALTEPPRTHNPSPPSILSGASRKTGWRWVSQVSHVKEETRYCGSLGWRVGVSNVRLQYTARAGGFLSSGPNRSE